MENSFLTLNSVSYAIDMHSILRNLSFSLNYGENIVFFGLESSGMDKICPIISGMLDEYDGEVIFENKSIKDLDFISKNITRKNIAYLQRGYGLISNLTVYDNIALPLVYHSNFSHKEINEKVEALLAEMDIEICRDLRPSDLRNSEILKCAYARAIVLDPRLLLVEHPLESQCSLNIVPFLTSLKKWAKSSLKSAIIVTYAPKAYLDVADKFIMLYAGSIVYQGCREDFLHTDNEYVEQYLSYSNKGPMLV